jgi:AcrR family transcriptional regulator
MGSLLVNGSSDTEQMFGTDARVHWAAFGTEQVGQECSRTMDRRVRKTREALYSAFTALVVERGYERISVQDIIDGADVGRTTFYAHFKTKEELLQFGFVRLREHLQALPRDTEQDRAALLDALLRHAKSHSGLFLALSQGRGGRLAEIEFGVVVEGLLADLPKAGDQHLMMTVMLGGALLAGIRRWIDSGAHGQGSEIMEFFEVLAKCAQAPQE